MRFTPKTESELSSMNLLDAGIYKYEVVEAEERLSSKGNEMIVVKLDIYDDSGFRRSLKDYLLEAMAFKLRHFCESAGLLDKYNSGELTTNELVGVSGKVDIAYQAGDQKPEGGYYPDKNVVADYIVPDASEPAKTPKKENPLDSEDIPF